MSSTAPTRGRKRKAEPAPPIEKRPRLTGGTVMCLGQNAMGQCGLGLNIAERKKPAIIKQALEGVECIQSVAGGVHTAALTADGKVYTFGCNDEFALGRTCVATADMDKDEVEALPGLAEGLDGVRIVALSAGDSHTFALADDGTVYGCGCFRDSNGALAFSDNSLMAKSFTKVYPPTEPVPGVVYPPAVAIDSGCDHVVLLAQEPQTRSTSVFTYGTGEQGQLGRLAMAKCSSREGKFRGAVPVRDPEFHALVSKKRTSLAVLTNLLKFHPVAAMEGKCIRSVHACGWSTFAVDSSGVVFSWGLNNYSQLGHGKRKGKIVMEYNPKKASSFKAPIKKLVGGQHHVVALTSDGSVLSLGRGDMGQLGITSFDTDKPETEIPKVVSGFGSEKIVDVAAGSACSFAVGASGKAFAWGFGENLQLTTGVEEDAREPVMCAGKQIDEKSIICVDAGGQHTTIVAK